MRNYFILLLAANVVLSHLQQSAEGACFKELCSITAELGEPLGGHYSYKDGEKNIRESNPTLYKLRQTRLTDTNKQIMVDTNEYEPIKFRHRHRVFKFESSSRTGVVIADDGHPCACNAEDKKIWKIYRALDDRFHLGWLMNVDERVGTQCVGTIGHLNSPNLPYNLPSYNRDFKMVHQCASWFLELLAELGQVNDGLVTTLEVNKDDGLCLFGYAPHNLITEDRFDWDYDDSSANYIFCFLDDADMSNDYPPGAWPDSALYIEHPLYYGEYKVQPMTDLKTYEFWTSSQMDDFDQALLVLRRTKVSELSSEFPNGVWTRRPGIDSSFYIKCESKLCNFYSSDSSDLEFGMNYDLNPLIGINFDKLWFSNSVPKHVSYRVDGDKIDYQIQDDIVITGGSRCAPIARKLVLHPLSTFMGYIQFQDTLIVTSHDCAVEATRRTNGGIVGVLKGPNGECTGIGPGLVAAAFIAAVPNEDGHYHCFNLAALFRGIHTKNLFKVDEYFSECKITLDDPMRIGMYKLDMTWGLNFYEFPMFIKYNTISGPGMLPYIDGEGTLDYSKRLIICYDALPPRNKIYYGGVCPQFKVVNEVINGEDVEIVIVRGVKIQCRAIPFKDLTINKIMSDDGIARSYYRMTTTECVVVQGYVLINIGIVYRRLRQVPLPITMNQCNVETPPADVDQIVQLYRGGCTVVTEYENLQFIWDDKRTARSCLKKAVPVTEPDPVDSDSVDENKK